MNTLEKLQAYLQRNRIAFQVLLHEEAHSAQKLAEALHIPGMAVVKVVIVKAASRYSMAVLPATRVIDLHRLSGVLGADKVTMAGELELRTLFPDTELGSIPPFGNLYGMPVIADRVLARDETITFSAGTAYQSVRMYYSDFEKLARPDLADFTRPAHD